MLAKLIDNLSKQLSQPQVNLFNSRVHRFKHCKREIFLDMLVLEVLQVLRSKLKGLDTDIALLIVQ